MYDLTFNVVEFSIKIQQEIILFKRVCLTYPNNPNDPKRPQLIPIDPSIFIIF